MKRDLRQDLASVSEEIRGNGNLIEFQVDLMERSVVASNSMLAAFSSAMEGSLVALPDTVVFLSNTVSTLNASFGAVDALIASGRFATIDDPTLRAGLAGLREKFVDATEEQLRVVSLRHDHMLPLQASDSRWQMAEVTRVSTEFWAAERVTGRQLVSYGIVEVPVSHEYNVFLRNRTEQYRLSAVEMRGLLAALDSLMVEIEQAM